MALSEALKAVIGKLNSKDVDLLTEYQKEREIMENMPYPLALPVAHTEDIVLEIEDAPVPVRIYTPRGEPPFPLLVYFHGGGWVTGSLHTHNEVCCRLANMAGHKVVSVDYRLAPENKFPAGLQDCYHAVCWVWRHADVLGGDPANISVAGDSAGGNIAAVVCQMAKESKACSIARQVLIYPAVGNQYGSDSPYPSVREFEDSHFLSSRKIREYLTLYSRDEKDLNDPRLAPILTEDLSGLPPALILTAELDPLRDEGEDYALRLQKAGVPASVLRLPGMIHGFISFGPAVSKVRHAYRVITAFLKGEDLRI